MVFSSHRTSLQTNEGKCWFICVMIFFMTFIGYITALATRNITAQMAKIKNKASSYGAKTGVLNNQFWTNATAKMENCMGSKMSVAPALRTLILIFISSRYLVLTTVLRLTLVAMVGTIWGMYSEGFGFLTAFYWSVQTFTAVGSHNICVVLF